VTDESKNTTLVKHTAAVHINNLLSLNQRKIANILLKNAYSELKNGSWHSMQVRDLLDQLGWKNTSNSTEMIKNDLKVLNSTQLEWNILKMDRKKVWNITTFLSDAKIENGTINYSYSLALRDALYNPNIYAKLDLMVQKRFKTKHAIVLWEYVLGELGAAGKSNVYTSVYTRWISLEELRKILGLQGRRTYSSFNALNQKVLIPGLEEVNEKSEINVSMKVRKEMRRIEWVRFIVEKDGVIGTDEDKAILLERKNGEIADTLGISPEQIVQDVKTYGENRVTFALEYTKKQIDIGKVINNVVAFYKVALRENWSEQVSSSALRKVCLDRNIDEIKGPLGFMIFMDTLRKRVGDEIFSSWFLNMEFVSKDDDLIVFRTDSAFKRDYITQNFLDKIKETASVTFGDSKDVDIIS
jgi:plasmid replication initiation protein